VENPARINLFVKDDMWLNHGTMGTTPGWFPQHGQNHRSYTIFFIIKRVWFLKASVARAFCILFKGLKINFARKESLSQKCFLTICLRNRNGKILFSGCPFKRLDSIPARLQAVVNSVWEFLELLSFVYIKDRRHTTNRKFYTYGAIDSP
jgi:hypothetical protein